MSLKEVLLWSKLLNLQAFARAGCIMMDKGKLQTITRSESTERVMAFCWGWLDVYCCLLLVTNWDICGWLESCVGAALECRYSSYLNIWDRGGRKETF
jgi:hypothetical protein